MNSMKYNELLEKVLLQYMEENLDEDFIFQQNNPSIHVSEQSQEWFQQKFIPLLQWPACSPDCNPIENLWGILASKVYANGRQFTTIQELRLCITECWNEIEVKTLQQLVKSMPSRIFEVIKRNGGHTKY